MTIRKKNKLEVKPSMLLLCATDAEATFFNQFRKDCRYSNLTVAKANGKTIEKMLCRCCCLNYYFSFVQPSFVPCENIEFTKEWPTVIGKFQIKKNHRC